MHCRTCGEQINEQAEFCPHCGVRPLRGNEYCQGCGTKTRSDQEVCINCGVKLGNSINLNINNDELIYPSPSPKSPILAALLSFLIPGLGQVYLKQTMKGLALLGGSIAAGILSVGVGGVVIWVVGIVDSYMIGKKLRDGKPVRQWEFF